MKHYHRLYAIDWKNGYLGLFHADTLEQYANIWIEKTSAAELLDELQNIYGAISIEFLENHAELNKLRILDGKEPKPTLC